MKRKVVCPMCQKPAEIASMGFFLYAHHCELGGWWYTNGVLWSQDREQVTPVERSRVETARQNYPNPDAGA